MDLLLARWSGLSARWLHARGPPAWPHRRRGRTLLGRWEERRLVLSVRSPTPGRSLGWGCDHQRAALAVGRAPRGRCSRTRVARLGAGRGVDGDGAGRGSLTGRRRLAAGRDDRGGRTRAGAAVA